MKRFFVSIFAIGLLSNSALAANPVVGGTAPVKKMEFDCKYVSNNNRTIEGVAYAKSPGADMSFALIRVFNKEVVTAQYSLDFVPDPELSMTWKFESKKRGRSLEIFGDDMGGMSTYTVGSRPISVTCSMSEL